METLATRRLGVTGLSFQCHRCVGLRGSTLKLLENTHRHLCVVATHEELDSTRIFLVFKAPGTLSSSGSASVPPSSPVVPGLSTARRLLPSIGMI